MAWRRILLAASSAGFALLAIEIALRGLVVPSPTSAGHVLGSELPPIRLIPPQPPVHQPRAGQPDRIRRDDLAGIVREDPLVGYVPRERAISSNGWWQSNNVGARARHDTAAEPLPGTTRVLVFGDSFAGGSRVPQEQAWPAVLDDDPDRGFDVRRERCPRCQLPAAAPPERARPRSPAPARRLR